LLERRRRFGDLDYAADRRNLGGVLFDQRRLIGLAAPASSEACSFGVGAASMKPHVLRSCAPRSARGTAVHAGRLDRVDELAIRGRIARDYSAPARIVERRPSKLCGVWREIHRRSFQQFDACNLALVARVRTPGLAFESMAGKHWLFR
jgi:hypothetical protein